MFRWNGLNRRKAIIPQSDCQGIFIKIRDAPPTTGQTEPSRQIARQTREMENLNDPNCIAKRQIVLVGLAYLSFIVLALPDGLLGVAWPSIRDTFHLSLDALGALLIATRIGYLAASFSNGRIATRYGIGLLLLAGMGAKTLGLLGYTIAPTWLVMVLVGVLVGIGGGAIDAGMNTYFAMNYSPRLMNWLHASFGLGATLGPALLTTIFLLGHSWRWGYAIAAIIQGGLMLCFLATRRDWQDVQSQGTDDGQRAPSFKASSLETLKLPAIWLSIGLFFLYAGVEVTAGQWSYSLFTESRSISVSTAGFWVSVYWGSFTAGRIFYGFVANRIQVLSALRFSMLTAIGAGLLIWWNITDTIGFLGLALMGFALAPVFPLLVTATPERLGKENAANAIGFQVGAASLGIAVLPGLAGVLAERWTLEVTGPFLVTTSLLLFLLHEVLIVQDNHRAT